MYKLDVGLGFSVIRQAIESFDMGIITETIAQHRIILTPNIINYYHNQIGSAGFAGAFIKDYIARITNISEKAVYSSSTQNYNDAKEEIIELVMGTPLKILISDEEEFADYKIKKIDLTTINDIKNKDFDHQFNWYVFPLSKTAEQDEECNKYIKWLRRLFMNERVITIVDPYLMAKFNLRCFLESILPTIPMETEIRLYSSMKYSTYLCNDTITGKKIEKDYHVEAERIISELNESNRNISINWCSGKNHDRYIVLSNCEINMSNSLIVLQKDGCFSTSCLFTVNKEKRKLPVTIEQALLTKQ